jgi:hypothetical protein
MIPDLIRLPVRAVDIPAHEGALGESVQTARRRAALRDRASLEPCPRRPSAQKELDRDGKVANTGSNASVMGRISASAQRAALQLRA